MLDRLAWAVAATLWAALIFWLSSHSSSDVELGWLDFPGFDKIVHGVVFGILAALCAQALEPLGEVRSLVIAVAIASAYGVSDELHQTFVEGRSPDVLDWVADTVGAALFVTGVWYLRR